MVSGKNIIIDRFQRSIVASHAMAKNRKGDKRCVCRPAIRAMYKHHPDGLCSHCKQPIRDPKPKRLYNRKTPRSLKKLSQLIHLAYENKPKGKHFFFVTITTMQHRTGYSDRELFYRFKLYIQHSGLDYINVVERQRLTGDLHFHIIVAKEGYFDIKYELARVAKCFNVPVHPALLEIKRIKNISTLRNYLSKYVAKPCPKMAVIQASWEKADSGEINPKTGKKYKRLTPYSSLFECRTFSISNRFYRLFKTKHYTFRRAITNRILISHRHLFREKFRSDFFVVYDFDLTLWAMACNQPKVPDSHGWQGFKQASC